MVCFDKSPLCWTVEGEAAVQRIHSSIESKEKQISFKSGFVNIFVFQRDDLTCGMRDGRHDNNKRAKNLKYYFVPEANVGSSSL
jgi:hypothetical protein